MGLASMGEQACFLDPACGNCLLCFVELCLFVCFLAVCDVHSSTQQQQCSQEDQQEGHIDTQYKL